MTELYINGTLMDLPDNFGVRLNRQLLNPAELNTKDAQFSFSITLPDTDRNNAALRYANVEETKDKFNRIYDAQLIVNGVRVFSGLFRMSETGRGYKGNLYVPEAKTVKDIFGALKLNENAAYRIPFSDFAASVNLYNLAAAAAPQPAIFPYTLFGVLPKVPLNRNANEYSDRNVWDASVRLGIPDLAPSINPLIMLRHIFASQGYTLQGTAFDDARLTQLYMSYRNAAEYTQPWNYGQHAKMQVSGSWSSRYNKRTGLESLERGVNQGNDETGTVYAIDFLDATNTQLTVIEDQGANVLLSEVNDENGRTWVRGQIRVPAAGFYKVRFDAQVHVFDWENWRVTDPVTGVQHIGGRTENANNYFAENIYEVRLSRDRGAAEFGLSGPRLNGTFYYNNQPQNTINDAQNIPKYFPQVSEDGQVNFIDYAQDPRHLLGFGFGRNEGGKNPEFINPQDSEGRLAQVQAAKPALSWDPAESGDEVTRLAIDSPGWWKWGRLGAFDNEGDNPDINVDFSGGTLVNGQVLNHNGNPVAPDPGNLAERIPGYALNASTGFQMPAAGLEVTGFIDLAAFSDITFSGTFEGLDGAAIVAFYDVLMQFIGAGVLAPATGAAQVTYTAEPVNPPEDAAFVRFMGPLTVNADSTADVNIILYRFPLQRYFTYRLTAPGYSGFAYLHNVGTVQPSARIDFVEGVAFFDTSYYPITSFAPVLTLYLRTPQYDVTGTLQISRLIEPTSEEVIGWELSNKYRIALNNAPANFARRGRFSDAPASPDWFAQGRSNAVVWLEAGELLTVSSVSSEGRYRRGGMHSTYGLVSHEVDFFLSVQPFRVDPDWLKVGLNGNGTAPMDWNDPVNFDTDSINLVGFLNSDQSTDDFIDNFVKAFNLKLTQTGERTFALDVKQNRQAVTTLSLDLDQIASVTQRTNTPLGLPPAYRLGFTVGNDEEGYVTSGEDGGGTFETGVIGGTEVEQKSNFSYNWFKEITKGADVLPLAVISKSDVWAPTMPYPEAMRKRYTDLPYRFWYYDGVLPGAFEFNGAPLQIAQVSDRIEGVSILNYHNARHTILDNYFTLLINGASHYTEVEAYLSAAQYEALNGALLARFNGDLYYVAELIGYDPGGRNKTKLKLIRII